VQKKQFSIFLLFAIEMAVLTSFSQKKDMGQVNDSHNTKKNDSHGDQPFFQG